MAHEVEKIVKIIWMNLANIMRYAFISLGHHLHVFIKENAPLKFENSHLVLDRNQAAKSQNLLSKTKEKKEPR